MFSIFVVFLQVIAIKGSYFDILVNSDASADALQYSLINKNKALSLISCLSACSLNMDCLTTVFSKSDLNCFFFRNLLVSSDIIASTTTNMYLKKNSKLNFKESTY